MYLPLLLSIFFSLVFKIAHFVVHYISGLWMEKDSGTDKYYFLISSFSHNYLLQGLGLGGLRWPPGARPHAIRARGRALEKIRGFWNPKIVSCSSRVLITYYLQLCVSFIDPLQHYYICITFLPILLITASAWPLTAFSMRVLMLSKYLILFVQRWCFSWWSCRSRHALKVSRVLQVHGVVLPRATRVPAPAGRPARLTQAPPLGRVGGGCGHPLVIYIHLSPSMFVMN